MKQLVIGAGPTGSATAQLLAEIGDHVTIVSRSGGGPVHPRIDRHALDASNAAQLVPIAAGAATVFDCAMPRYDRWAEEFPPIADAVLAAARAANATLITVSNVYPYGAGPQPFTEASPLVPISGKGRVRARMWHDALASGARVCEVRGSDYLGRGAASVFTLMALSALRAGAPVSLPADLDADHSWTFTGDVARTLVAASRSDASWGRAWHVPSTTRSIRALAARLCEIGGLPAPRLTRMTHGEFAALAAGDSILAAVTEMLYLFDGPAVIEASETTRVLGVTVTPFDDVLADTLAG